MKTFKLTHCFHLFSCKFLLWCITFLLILYSALLLTDTNNIRYLDVYASDESNKTFSEHFANPFDIEFETRCGIYGCIDENIDFEEFDNGRFDSITTKNLTREIIVPNLVHLLYLRKNEMSFLDMICLYSIYLNHRPTIIYIHCDECEFKGRYWEEVQNQPQIWDIIIINQLPKKMTIFGVPTTNMELITGITRIQVLMNYGGIYLDSDVYVVNSLRKYRAYEQTVSWFDVDQPVDSQVIIAHRNSRLLRAYFDSYRYNMTDEANYNLGKGRLLSIALTHHLEFLIYFSKGLFPAKVLTKHANLGLAHIVKEKLGTHINHISASLYTKKWIDWKTMDTIHLGEDKGEHKISDMDWKKFADTTVGLMIQDVIERINAL